MLMLNDQTREELWRRLIEVIESYLTKIDSTRVAPELDVERIRAELAWRDFAKPASAVEALDFVADAMWRFQVHTRHPRYFGLFNPASATMGIAADALVAAFNPQLAAWSHSPFAAEVERHLVRAFGQKFGYDLSVADGVFTSGGSEANHTALLTALAIAFPEFGERGLRAAPAQPVFYISSQGHHSFLKAARASGLGTAAVREIRVDDDLRMDVGALADRVARDRGEGFTPLMVVATAGTTSAGAIDPIGELAEVAARERAWFHVDAAWGGAAAFVPELRATLDGIEKADSITVEAFYGAEGLYVAAGRRLGRACRGDSASDRDGRLFATEASGIGLGSGQSHPSARRLFYRSRPVGRRDRRISRRGPQIRCRFGRYLAFNRAHRERRQTRAP